MKRSVQAGRDQIEATSMADCLMLLSRESTMCTPTHDSSSSSSSSRRVFECKTCNRQFRSFQALGGHRASHRRPRLDSGGEKAPAANKAKAHECSVCGSEFAVGQALGGHMRRHRGHVPVVVMKKSSRRVLCLDLNLTPVENDLEFRLAFNPHHPMLDWPAF